MQECVSLWPGTIAENNERRRLFKDGMNAAKGLGLVAGVKYDGDLSKSGPYYEIVPNTPQPVDRIDSDIYQLVSTLFPVITMKIVKGLEAIVVSRPAWKRCRAFDGLH